MIFKILQHEVSSWDENCAGHWTVGAGSGCLLCVAQGSMKAEGSLLPCFGSFLFASSFFKCKHVALLEGRESVGVIITCRLWDRQFWKLLKQDHWDHFVKTLSNSPVNALEEKSDHLHLSFICCLSYSARLLSTPSHLRSFAQFPVHRAKCSREITCEQSHV